jgi:hypothetical protein
LYHRKGRTDFRPGVNAKRARNQATTLTKSHSRGRASEGFDGVFAWIEGGWVLALSVLLIVATVWLVQRGAA